MTERFSNGVTILFIVILSGTKCSRNIPGALGALALHKASPIGEAVNGKEPLTEEDKKLLI